MKGPSKRQKNGQGLYLRHANLFAMTARYITHWFLYLKAKILILLHMQIKKVNLKTLFQI